MKSRDGHRGQRARSPIWNLVSASVCVLPASRVKNSLLNALGHCIAPKARFSPTLAWQVDCFSVAEGAIIRRGNIFRSLGTVTLEQGAIFGQYNYVSASPVFKAHFGGETYGRLTLRRHAKVSSRHTFDCSAAIEIGEYSSVAGHGTLFLSHSTDLVRNDQVARPILVGSRSFVGSHCTLLGGAALPSRSVLGAGAVLTKSSMLTAKAGLWTGVPARWRKGLEGLWFERASTRTTSLYDPVTETRIDRAFD
jgi:acetyltransferase-like isoleucine patch superfamily enzyme